MYRYLPHHTKYRFSIQFMHLCLQFLFLFLPIYMYDFPHLKIESFGFITFTTKYMNTIIYQKNNHQEHILYKTMLFDVFVLCFILFFFFIIFYIFFFVFIDRMLLQKSNNNLVLFMCGKLKGKPGRKLSKRSQNGIFFFTMFPYVFWYL